MEPQQQVNNRPGTFKKGQSGNPGGRPKGTISLKRYAQDYLLSLTPDEKEEFMEGLPKDIIWKMAEGNPETKTDITTAGEKLPPQIIVYGETDPLRVHLNGENTVQLDS